MLTREHAIAVYERGKAYPDRLKRGAHREYLGLAARMLQVYRHGAGRTRRELHHSVARILEAQPECPPRRVAAFCKLLDEAAIYDTDLKGRAAKLRRQVFRAAAAMHPLVTEVDGWFEHEHLAVKQRIAEELKLTWPEIERSLFADVIEFHTLREFPGYAAATDLLARYNVAQTQAALFDAVRLRVWAQRDLKVILRYAKLAKLMHSIERIDDTTYRFDFDGPASILTSTRRYGVNMAKFLPGLLACQQWRLAAELHPPRWHGRVVLQLSSADGLTSTAAEVVDFDSDLERDFAEKWGAQPRDGWRLLHEADILHAGQKVFMPDFTFVGPAGQRVLLEIVGFWTPEYIAQKVDTLQNFSHQPILLAVAESTVGHFEHLAESGNVRIVTFKKKLGVQAVFECLPK